MCCDVTDVAARSPAASVAGQPVDGQPGYLTRARRNPRACAANRLNDSEIGEPYPRFKP